MLILYTGI